MSTLMSTDMSYHRPSTRVRASPGGKTSICFGDEFSAAVPAVASSTVEPVTPASAPAEAKRMDYLSVPSSSKLVGIALATTVGAEDITVAISKSLAARGIANVVVSFVEDPAILPFVAKSMSETCHVVLAVAVLNGEAKAMAQFLTKALTETGLETGCPVIPGLMSPSSYLELKALLPACATSWSNSVSAIIAVKGGVQPVPVTEIVSEAVLASAAIIPAAITAETSNLDELLFDLRESFKSHGARGICGIARSFRIMDDNNSKTLDINEFSKGITEHTLNWSPAQVKLIFDFFDSEKNGQISYDEFLVAIRGGMNDRRQQMCLLAFEILDKDKSGIVEINDISSVYNAKKHPDVIAGKKTEEDVLREFLDTFDVGGVPDGKVTPKEFLNYYNNVSSSIDNDDYFELMMRNAWHISGGEGWCANSSCLRVLCTHEDGHQSVEEMKNDLGLNKNDEVAMLANLKAQGITTVVKIATTSVVEDTKPAAEGAAKPDGSPRANNRRAPGGQTTLILG